MAVVGELLNIAIGTRQYVKTGIRIPGLNILYYDIPKLKLLNTDIFDTVKSVRPPLLPEFAKVAAKNIDTLFKLGNKSIHIDLKPTDTLDNIIERIIKPGKDYYLDDGVLRISEARIAKDAALQSVKRAKDALINMMRDRQTEIKTAFGKDINYYKDNRTNPIIQRMIKQKKLDELLQKSPNITINDIAQYYQKTPEQFRPSQEQYKAVVDILNNKSFATGKIKNEQFELLTANIAKADSDFNKVKNRVALNTCKESAIAEEGDGIIKIYTRNQKVEDFKECDVIRITAKDKDKYLQIIRENYSEIVNPDDTHSMHRLLQRYAGATDKGTPVDFEKMTEFLDTIKDIKKNPQKYNLTGGVPNLANGDIRIGFQLSSGETSRGGCALVIPNGGTSCDMIILNSEGKITTSFPSNQNAINTGFIPILPL